MESLYLLLSVRRISKVSSSDHTDSDKGLKIFIYSAQNQEINSGSSVTSERGGVMLVFGRLSQ